MTPTPSRTRSGRTTRRCRSVNYVDALEPTDPETIAPHPDVHHDDPEVDAHELKRAVATVFGSGDGAVGHATDGTYVDALGTH